MTTWRKEFESVRGAIEFDDERVIAVAPDESVLDVEFDDGYGSAQGPAILIWTERFVYFPVVYDGAEWLGSAPRYPRASGQSHVGGE